MNLARAQAKTIQEKAERQQVRATVQMLAEADAAVEEQARLIEARGLPGSPPKGGLLALALEARAARLEAGIDPRIADLSRREGAQKCLALAMRAPGFVLVRDFARVTRECGMTQAVDSLRRYAREAREAFPRARGLVIADVPDGERLGDIRFELNLSGLSEVIATRRAGLREPPDLPANSARPPAVAAGIGDWLKWAAIFAVVYAVLG